MHGHKENTIPRAPSTGWAEAGLVQIKQHWIFAVVCAMTKQMTSNVHSDSTIIVYLNYVCLSANTIKVKLSTEIDANSMQTNGFPLPTSVSKAPNQTDSE